MSFSVFWILGLLAIGIVTSILSKCFRVYTTDDSGTAKGIILWGCVMMTLWIFYGGILIGLQITSK